MEEDKIMFLDFPEHEQPLMRTRGDLEVRRKTLRCIHILETEFPSLILVSRVFCLQAICNRAAVVARRRRGTKTQNWFQGECRAFKRGHHYLDRPANPGGDGDDHGGHGDVGDIDDVGDVGQDQDDKQ